MKKIRVGIAGAGKIADSLHAPGFKAEPAAELAAVCNHNIDKAKKLAEKYGISGIYDDYRKMIDKAGLDAVAICTPNYLHAPVALYAMKRGLHVFTEKPMAMNIKEMHDMVDEARRRKVVLAVNHNCRFFPASYVLRKMIRAGVIGKVESLRGRLGYSGFEHWKPGSIWFTDKRKSGGGALVDLGVHIYDLMRFVTGKEAVSVCATASTMTRGMEVDDNFSALVKFEDATCGEFEASWTTRPSELSMVLYGERGKAVYEGLKGTVEIYVSDSARPDRVKKILKPAIPKQSPLGTSCGNFINACLGKEKPLSDGRDAMKSTAVVLAALRAAGLKEFVRVKA